MQAQQGVEMSFIKTNDITKKKTQPSVQAHEPFPLIPTCTKSPSNAGLI